MTLGLSELRIVEENLSEPLADLPESKSDPIKTTVVELLGAVGSMSGGNALYRQALKIGFANLSKADQDKLMAMMRKASDQMELAKDKAKQTIDLAVSVMRGPKTGSHYGAPPAKPAQKAAWTTWKQGEHNRMVDASKFESARELNDLMAEDAPPGWAGTIKAMKKHMPADKAFALAWDGYKKGKKPHYKDAGSTKDKGEPVKKKRYQDEGSKMECKDCPSNNACDCKNCDRDCKDCDHDCKMDKNRRQESPRNEGVDDGDRDFLDTAPSMAADIGKEHEIGGSRSKVSRDTGLADALAKGLKATGPAPGDIESIDADRGDLGINDILATDANVRTIQSYQDSMAGEDVDPKFEAALSDVSINHGYELPYDLGQNRDLSTEKPVSHVGVTSAIKDGKAKDNKPAKPETVSALGVAKVKHPTRYTAEESDTDWSRPDTTRNVMLLRDLEQPHGSRRVVNLGNLIYERALEKMAKDGLIVWRRAHSTYQSLADDHYELTKSGRNHLKSYEDYLKRISKKNGLPPGIQFESVDTVSDDERIRLAEAFDRLIDGSIANEDRADGERYLSLVERTGSTSDYVARYRSGESIDSIINDLRSERARLKKEQGEIFDKAKAKFDAIESDLGFIRRVLTRKENIDQVFESMLSEEGHHYFDGKDYYADTAFMNSMRGIMPGHELKHIGFGEFSFVGPEGEVEFDRSRGKNFPGQSGRSHKLYDNQDGKLIKKLIAAMEKRGKSELVKESFDEGGANLTEANNGKVSTFLAIMSSHLTQFDQRLYAGETKRGGRDNIYRMGHYLGALDKIQDDVKGVQDSDSPEAMAKLKASVGKRFERDFPPAKKLIKQIDDFVQSGKLPKTNRTESLDESKLTGKKLDTEISRLFKKHGDRVRFNIMDLGKIRKAGVEAAASGEDIEAAIVAAIQKYRVESSERSGTVLGEAAKSGQFFVIIDKKTGKAASEIYDSSRKADAELEKRGGERKTGQQVVDAMWHNPSRAKLKHAGIAESLFAAVASA